MKRTILSLVIVAGIVGSVRADETIQSVQQVLKDKGFYFGEVTGDKSADTTAAIRRYQIRNGLQVTGEINEETLRSLHTNSNSASSTQSVTKPAVPPPSNLRPDRPTQPYPSASSPVDRPVVVAELQRQLASRGYYRGRIDGIYGRRTAFAVRSYQWRAGIAPTGRLDAPTLRAMGLSDWNAAYFAPAAWPDGRWASMKRFPDDKWRGKWESRYRDGDYDEHDEDLYGIWERPDREFEHRKRDEEWRKDWEEWNKKRWEEWKKRDEEQTEKLEWNKKASDAWEKRYDGEYKYDADDAKGRFKYGKWEKKWKKYHREGHKHDDDKGKEHGDRRHEHDDD